MAERAGQLIVVARSERVAVVLDHPEIVALGEIADDVQVERHAKCVRHHDRARLRTDRRSQLIGIGRVVAKVDVDEHRHEPVLQDRRERRRKPRGDRDRPRRLAEAADFASFGEVERGQGHEVGGRSRVHQQRVGNAEVVREIRLEPLRVAVRRQEEVEAGVDEVAQFFRVEHTSGVVGQIVCGIEGAVRELRLVVLANQRRNLLPEDVALGHVGSLFTILHALAPANPVLDRFIGRGARDCSGGLQCAMRALTVLTMVLAAPH